MKDSQSLQSAIEAVIRETKASGVIAIQVRDVFAKREIDRLTDLVIKGVDSLVKLQAALESIDKPDTQITTEDGAVIKGSTPKRVQEVNAAKKKLDTLANALNTALGSADFKSLEKALKGGGDKAEEAAE